MPAAPTTKSIASNEKPSFLLAGTLLLFAITFLAYWPSLRGGFLWDDDVLITNNPHLKAPGLEGLAAIWFSTQQPDYLPLTSTTFWLEWRLWEINATGYRVTNALLHALNSILLWRLLKQLQVNGAFFAAAIFAVHPVCVASTAWIAERKNTLSMLFFLLSISWFRKNWRHGSRITFHASRFTFHASRFYWLSLAAFFLALLSKASVVMLPFVLLAVVWWNASAKAETEERNGAGPRLSILDSRLWVPIAPFFLLSLVFGLVTIWFQFQRSIGEQAVNQLPFWEKFIAAIWALGFYISKAVWPTSLAMVYPQWELKQHFIFHIIPALFLFVLGFCTWRFWKVHLRHALLAAGYFVLMLLPVLGFVNMYFLVYSRVADHWQYLAILGVIVPVAAGTEHFALRVASPKRRALYIFARWILPSGIVAALSLLTWQRAELFANSESLWRDTLSKNPKCWAAHSHLGNAFAERIQHEEAINHFLQALALKPDFADAHFNLANSLAALGQLEKAALHFTQAIQFKPRYPEAHYNFGLALERLGKSDEALAHYLQAIQINPTHAGAHNNAGNLLAQSGRDAEAAQHYEAALRWKPNLPEAENNLANVLQRMGRVEESVPHYLKALALKPGYVDAHRNLAIALQTLGRNAEAAAHLEEAKRLEAASVK